VNTQAATTTNNTQTLTYGVGNRLNKNTTTRLVGTVANNTHQAITIDAAGNITNDGIRKYIYTAGNQLSSILVNNITTQYIYDINNRRVSKASGTNSMAYTYAEDIGDGSTAFSATSLLGEYTATATKEYIYLGDTPIAVVQAGNILTIQTDHLDTPRQLTDNTKKVVWNWAYSAFGENQPTNTNNTVFNLRYPGQYYDAESKLHYNINRYYDPATGRYTQSDPIGLSGGINTYTYVGGNSIRWSDSSGLQFDGNCFQQCISDYPLLSNLAPFSFLPVVNLKLPTEVKPNASIFTTIDRRLPAWTGSKVRSGATVARGAINRTKYIGRYGTVAVAVGVFATSYSATAAASCLIQSYK
jgi:RHS repeat-associated protein